MCGLDSNSANVAKVLILFHRLTDIFHVRTWEKVHTSKGHLEVVTEYRENLRLKIREAEEWMCDLRILETVIQF